MDVRRTLPCFSPPYRIVFATEKTHCELWMRRIAYRRFHSVRVIIHDFYSKFKHRNSFFPSRSGETQETHRKSCVFFLLFWIFLKFESHHNISHYHTNWIPFDFNLCGFLLLFCMLLTSFNHSNIVINNIRPPTHFVHLTATKTVLFCAMAPGQHKGTSIISIFRNNTLISVQHNFLHPSLTLSTLSKAFEYAEINIETLSFKMKLNVSRLARARISRHFIIGSHKISKDNLKSCRL